jgi:hypothetical protein
MPRTFAAAVLLAAMALLATGSVVAGPPEGVSGKMALDNVEDGLRRYRQEKDNEKRYRLLERLALTRDPRVALALGELLRCADEDDRFVAATLLIGNYGATPPRTISQPAADGFIEAAGAWWKKNEAGLRRRAAQLPR